MAVTEYLLVVALPGDSNIRLLCRPALTEEGLCWRLVCKFQQLKMLLLSELCVSYGTILKILRLRNFVTEYLLVVAAPLECSIWHWFQPTAACKTLH
jgi:hypothetical protein